MGSGIILWYLILSPYPYLVFFTLWIVVINGNGMTSHSFPISISALQGCIVLLSSFFFLVIFHPVILFTSVLVTQFDILPLDTNIPFLLVL